MSALGIAADDVASVTVDVRDIERIVLDESATKTTSSPRETKGSGAASRGGVVPEQERLPVVASATRIARVAF